MSVLPDWPYAYSGPESTGNIRRYVEDFEVNEQLGFELSGKGEHVFLWIEKRGENTDYIARQLARFAKVHCRDIGYAGLKDRHALTRQWFSVYLPGKEEPGWTAFSGDRVKVLRSTRHNRKLKRGVLQGNHFNLTIRDWDGSQAGTRQRLEIIKNKGIPNYFGPQRFGRSGQNLNKAVQMFRGQRVKRQQRSLYLSAARAFLFNQILAHRVQRGDWDKALSGDTFIFDKSHQYFKSTQADSTILQRLEHFVIHPSGCLYGLGETDNCDLALSLETQIIERFPVLREGLEKSGVHRSRRALRVRAEDLRWHINQSVLTVAFFLPAGSYATSLLREFIDFKEF